MEFNEDGSLKVPYRKMNLPEPRRVFKKEELVTLRHLVALLSTSTTKEKRDKYRAKLRKMGFKITNFKNQNSYDPFSLADLEKAISSGRLVVE